VSIPEQMRGQAEWCERLGSPLYAFLLERLAEDYEAGGPVRPQLDAQAADDVPFGSMLQLRLMGSLHRLALDGTAPELAAAYPSTGGSGDPDQAWAAVQSTLTEHADAIERLIPRPVQTNEVGRSAAIGAGLLWVARREGLPLRLLELGASAGLLLRWDRYHYSGDGYDWGDAGSPVQVQGSVVSGAPPFEGRAEIAERSGCDAAPVDPASEDGRLTLLSYVWPDQAARFAMLRGALDIAREMPVVVERAQVDDWLARQLREPVPGTSTVVFHSIVIQYVPPERRERLDALLAAAGERATAEAPLHRLTFEPDVDHAALRLTSWPDGEERRLAACGFHGRDIRWLADA
jgi:hypothetical protein